MQDNDRAQREFYQQASNWFTLNSFSSGSQVAWLAIILSLLLVIALIFLVFAYQDKNKSFEALNIQYQQLLTESSDSQFQDSQKEISTQIQLNNLENNLNRAEKTNKNLKSEIQKLQRNLGSQQEKLLSIQNDKNVATQALELSRFKASEAQKQLTTYETNYKSLLSEFTLANQKLSQFDVEQANLLNEQLRQLILPIWLEQSQYFKQPVLALYLGHNQNLASYVVEQLEYVYFKVDGVEINSSDILRPSETSDALRGYYFVVYLEKDEELHGLSKQAFLKFKDQQSELEINFY